MQNNLQLRRFIIEKSAQAFLKNEMDAMHQIAASLQLGPLLFVEFCAHCKYDGDEVALSRELAQLSLQALTQCVDSMAMYVDNHPLSKAARVSVLLQSCIEKFDSTFSDGDKEQLGILNPGNDPSPNLLKRILASFTQPFLTSGKMGVLKELLINNFDEEASQLCELIRVAASTLGCVNGGAEIGLSILKCFEDLNSCEKVVGPLNLIEANGTGSCGNCTVKAVDVAIYLSGSLDGCTAIPLGGRIVSGRDEWGFPLLRQEDWSKPCDAEASSTLSDDERVSLRFGVPRVVASTILRHFGAGPNFSQVETDKIHSESSIAACIAVALDAGSSIINEEESATSKQLEAIASLALSSVDAALSETDFVMLKVITSLGREEHVDVAKDFAACRLGAVIDIISNLAPCCGQLDVSCNFVSSVMRITKRFYAVLNKFTASFMSTPSKLISPGPARELLQEISSKMTHRITCLLLDVQEKRNVGSKFLAEGKIESQGKVAALVVFEREKSDAILLKLCKKLKMAGLTHEVSATENGAVLEGKELIIDGSRKYLSKFVLNLGFVLTKPEYLAGETSGKVFTTRF